MRALQSDVPDAFSMETVRGSRGIGSYPYDLFYLLETFWRNRFYSLHHSCNFGSLLLDSSFEPTGIGRLTERGMRKWGQALQLTSSQPTGSFRR
jgi:hypothetical protein